MEDTIEKKIFEEGMYRKKMRYEGYTRKKIDEIQSFLSKYEVQLDSENDKNAGNSLKKEFGDNYERLAQFVDSLKLENKVNKETLDCLKKKNEDLKKRLSEDAADKEKKWRLEKREIERNFEDILEKNHKQIETLVEDKKELVGQNEILYKKLMDLDKLSVEKIETLKNNYLEKMKKQRGEWDQQHKIKLKTWKEKKTRELKDMTIKGLEPELNRLIKKGEEEKQKLKVYYESLLKDKEKEFEDKIFERVEIEKAKLKEENEKVLQRDRASLEHK